METNTLDFSGHYACQDSVGVSTVRYVFFDQDNTSDSVCVNVKYDTRPLGIDNTLNKNNYTLNAYPNPADNSVTFVYNLAQETSASVVVRNVLGSLVKKIDLADYQGKISLTTTDLDNGIYFYSLVENGLSVGTRKLVVKH